MEHDEVPKWIRVLFGNRFVRAVSQARMRKAGLQHCDRCGQELGDRSYLLVKARFIFWTESVTCLCPECFKSEAIRLRQTGALPPQA